MAEDHIIDLSNLEEDYGSILNAHNARRRRRRNRSPLLTGNHSNVQRRVDIVQQARSCRIPPQSDSQLNLSSSQNDDRRDNSLRQADCSRWSPPRSDGRRDDSLQQADRSRRSPQRSDSRRDDSLRQADRSRHTSHRSRSPLRPVETHSYRHGDDIDDRSQSRSRSPRDRRRRNDTYQSTDRSRQSSPHSPMQFSRDTRWSLSQSGSHRDYVQPSRPSLARQKVCGLSYSSMAPGGNATSSSSHPPNAISTGTVKFKVILLAKRDKRKIVSADELPSYEKHALIIRLIEFEKTASEFGVKQTIKDNFYPHLLGNSIEGYLIASGEELYRPKIGRGSCYSAKTLSSIFKQQTVYAQPEFDLDIEEEEEIDGEVNESEDPNPNEFRRRRQRSNSSDEELSNCVNESNAQNEENGENLDSEINEVDAQDEFDISQRLENDSPPPVAAAAVPAPAPLPPVSLMNLLSTLREQIQEEEVVEWEINREDILNTAKPFLLNEQNHTKKIKIKFLGEEGVDNDGLKMDFFQTALNEFKNSRLFYGDDHKKYFNRSNELERDKMPFCYGVLLSLSFIHLGAIPDYLSRFIHELIFNGSSVPSISQIQYQAARQDIENLSLAATFEEANAILTTSEALAVCGSPPTIESMASIHIIVRDAINFYALNEKVYEGFLKGLDVLGVLTNMRLYPQLFKPAFQFTPPLDNDSFLRLFDIKESPLGSLENQNEVRAIFLFGMFLSSLENSELPIRIEDVLSWVTGFEKEPIGGFAQKPTIAFHHSDPNNPMPDTLNCHLRLFLPVCYNSPRADLPRYTKLFIYAVKNRAFMRQ